MERHRILPLGHELRLKLRLPDRPPQPTIGGLHFLGEHLECQAEWGVNGGLGGHIVIAKQVRLLWEAIEEPLDQLRSASGRVPRGLSRKAGVWPRSCVPKVWPHTALGCKPWPAHAHLHRGSRSRISERCWKPKSASDPSHSHHRLDRVGLLVPDCSLPAPRSTGLAEHRVGRQVMGNDGGNRRTWSRASHHLGIQAVGSMGHRRPSGKRVWCPGYRWHDGTLSQAIPCWL